jgi:hypothetical protein
VDRTMTVFLPVVGPLERLSEVLAGDPRMWLPPPSEPRGSEGWMVHLRAGPVSYPVLCCVGSNWRDGDSLWRALTWSPHGGDALGRITDRALPDFVGELGLLPQTDPTLVLTGQYNPPGGAVGAIGDRAVMHRIADTTARRFLVEVAQCLASPVVAQE